MLLSPSLIKLNNLFSSRQAINDSIKPIQHRNTSWYMKVSHPMIRNEKDNVNREWIQLFLISKWCQWCHMHSIFTSLQIDRIDVTHDIIRQRKPENVYSDIKIVTPLLRILEGTYYSMNLNKNGGRSGIRDYRCVQ